MLRDVGVKSDRYFLFNKPSRQVRYSLGYYKGERRLQWPQHQKQEGATPSLAYDVFHTALCPDASLQKGRSTSFCFQAASRAPGGALCDAVSAHSTDESRRFHLAWLSLLVPAFPSLRHRFVTWSEPSEGILFAARAVCCSRTAGRGIGHCAGMSTGDL